jgi:hypothetical protein
MACASFFIIMHICPLSHNIQENERPYNKAINTATKRSLGISAKELDGKFVTRKKWKSEI